jgi:hypothetical protein
MRIASLDSGRDQLRDAGETLERAWADTCEVWKDANARNVEENHLAPLHVELVKMLSAIQLLDDVLKQAGRECEPS